MSATGLLLLLSLGGCGSSDPTHPVDAVSYRSYLTENSDLLIAAIQSMLAEIRAGEVARAQSRYARARVRYSQIEPAAEGFPKLDQRIDGLQQEVPSSMFGGFHRIEKALFRDETTAGMTAVAERLLDDVKQLQVRFKSAELTAPGLAEAMERILAEISSSKLKGKEEPYSNTTLVDVSANVEGVMALAEALKPTLEAEPALASALRKALKRAYAEMGEFGTPASDPDQPRGRSPGALFIWFEEVPPASVAKIEQHIEAIRRPVAELRRQLKES